MISLITGKDECYLMNKAIFDSQSKSIQPQDCTSINIDCCYIYVNYNIGVTKIENSYCSTLKTSKEKFAKTVKNMYQDEIKWYANNTYLNYPKYKTIGKNLNYTYYLNYRCYKPPKREDYSTYTNSICAKFNSNGECLVTNDENKFALFVDNLYQQLSNSNCSDPDSSCKNPFNPSTQQNDKLMPLVDLLTYALRVGNDTDINKETDDTGSEWPDECIDIPDGDVRVVCDDNFVSGSFLKVFVYMTLILFYLY
jgi:hypothetical protein